MIKCIDCERKCYEYLNNSTSDKAYYEWTLKQDKCDAEDDQTLQHKGGTQ